MIFGSGGTAGFGQDVGMPTLEGGQPPSSYIQAYLKAITTRISKLGDAKAKLPQPDPATPKDSTLTAFLIC